MTEKAKTLEGDKMDASDWAEFEVGMLTICYLMEGLEYEEADAAARKEYRELQEEV